MLWSWSKAVQILLRIEKVAHFERLVAARGADGSGSAGSSAGLWSKDGEDGGGSEEGAMLVAFSMVAAQLDGLALSPESWCTKWLCASAWCWRMPIATSSSFSSSPSTSPTALLWPSRDRRVGLCWLLCKNSVSKSSRTSKSTSANSAAAIDAAVEGERGAELAEVEKEFGDAAVAADVVETAAKADAEAEADAEADADADGAEEGRTEVEDAAVL
mmetsp:Transcript_22683/g.32025  ORF Transcript_22683/g.32025 Transcript_22683/m.32025 type:complete len:216 (+) Transcript_22683:260-907(+)